MSGLAVSAVVGWTVAGAAMGMLLALRRRLRMVARAEHELRGPVTVLSLAAERLRRDRAAERHAFALECELARLCQGLDDLAAARVGGRARPNGMPVPLETLARSALAGWAPLLRRGRLRWDPRARAAAIPSGRAAQALGNLLANAAEHGGGEVELSGRPTSEGVRVEVRSEGGERRPSPRRPGRGQGLAIVREAVEEAGGRLSMSSDGGETVVALDLPATDDHRPAA